MKKAIKAKGKIVQAYKLGNDDHPVIRDLISKGLLKVLGDGKYQVFSQEAVNGSGQLVEAGYYLRIDSTGTPYPNSPEFVKENLRHLGGDDYEQVPQPLYFWTESEGICPEIEFLINQKELVIDESSTEKYFNAPLWGTLLSARKDAFLVFYKLTRDEAGNILDAEFNFIEHNEFLKTYTILE